MRQFPDLPLFNVIDRNESSITLGKLSDALPSGLEFLEYRIQCGVDRPFEPLDINANDYQCQSLESGTSHLVTFSVLDTRKNLQRSHRVFATTCKFDSLRSSPGLGRLPFWTVLEKSQYKNHYYSSEVNGTRSIMIEWIPPTKNFDTVQIMCLLASERYDYNRTSSPMYFKCNVTSGSSFSVTFITIKRNQPSAVFVFNDTPPGIRLFESTTVKLNCSLRLVDSMTTKPSQNDTTILVTSTRVNSTITSRMTTGTTSVIRINTTVNATGTWASPSGTPTTDGSSLASPSSAAPVLTELARWRIYAIISFVLAGFLVFVSLALAVLASVLCCRNRWDSSWIIGWNVA